MTEDRRRGDPRQKLSLVVREDATDATDELDPRPARRLRARKRLDSTGPAELAEPRGSVPGALGEALATRLLQWAGPMCTPLEPAYR
jgi:hypothetical protein